MVDYKNCSIWELRTFAKQRRLTVQGTKSKRHNKRPAARQYRAALKKADRDCRFRFLDLPAEIRNRIFEEVLGNGDLTACQPGITVTSKQMYKEASGILYAANQFEIKILRHNIKAQGISCRPSTGDIRDFKWPVFLKRAQIVLLKLENTERVSHYKNHNPEDELLHSECKSGPLSDGNHILYSLCSFLEQDNCLKSLTIDLVSASKGRFDGHINETGSCRCRRRALFPLSMLKGLKNLSITGLSPSTNKWIMSTIMANRPQHSILPRVEDILRRA